MSIVKIIINYPGQKVMNRELDMNTYFDMEEKLVNQISTKGGRLSVFLDGWYALKIYPEKIVPVAGDRVLSVILDKGDEKKGYEMYESEFAIVSEIWREKKWGFSAVDMLGNTIALEEYDYISRLQETGKVYAGSRRVYNVGNEKEIGGTKGFLAELAEGLKKDYSWLFGFFKKNK